MANYSKDDEQRFLRILRAIHSTEKPTVIVYGINSLCIEADNGSWLEIEGSKNGTPATGAVWGYDADGKQNFFPEDARQ